MTKTAEFAYVTYIVAAPEKVWNAIVDGEAAAHYWGHRTESDWKSGSPWRLRRADGSGIVQIAGAVVESSPPDRLVLTWAYADNADNAEKGSRVTFLLQPHPGGSTKLTVRHDELESGSEMEAAVSSGWPMVLSNLKSFLENGKTVQLQSVKERANA
jgi:uncharacterized protein YndB with AHSA1/START domain